MFRVLVWLVAIILDSTDIEHCIIAKRKIMRRLNPLIVMTIK